MSNLGKGKHDMHEARDLNPIFIASRIVKGFLSGRQEDTAYSDTNFKAFISYKHSVSTNFALRLEQALKVYAKPLLARPIRIFRDEKHFAPGIDLPKLIVNALNVSEFLILLASPEAANSVWVCDELVHWCAGLKQTKNLIIVLVEGEIAVDNDTQHIYWRGQMHCPPC